MVDLHEMLLVLMNYERTETEKVRRDIVRDIMEALVQREKLLTEVRVIESLEKLVDNSSVISLTIDKPFDSKRTFVVINDKLGKENGERAFTSDQSLLDALAQCVHTLKNEKPRT